MEHFRYNTGVIKLGTEVVTDLMETGKFDHIIDQIVAIRRQVEHVIVVSSGAVALGRDEMRGAEGFVAPDETQLENGDLLELKRMYAAVGQPKLHDMYASGFRRHNLRAPQILLRSPEELRSVVPSALHRRSLIPVVNENDAIASAQFFSDNDDLAQRVAEITHADFVCFLTQTNGVMRDVTDESSNIRQVALGDETWRQFVKEGTSNKGKGGMMSKCEKAQALAEQGIWAHIASGRSERVLERILNDEQIGTRFLAPVKS